MIEYTACVNTALPWETGTPKLRGLIACIFGDGETVLPSRKGCIYLSVSWKSASGAGSLFPGGDVRKVGLRTETPQPVMRWHTMSYIARVIPAEVTRFLNMKVTNFSES